MMFTLVVKPDPSDPIGRTRDWVVDDKVGALAICHSGLAAWWDIGKIDRRKTRLLITVSDKPTAASYKCKWLGSGDFRIFADDGTYRAYATYHALGRLMRNITDNLYNGDFYLGVEVFE